MTDEGVLMTSKGEPYWPATFKPGQHIHIVSWHQSSTSERQVVSHIGELEENLNWNEGSVIRIPAPFAYMVFFIEGSSSGSFSTNSQQFPGFQRYQHNLMLVHDKEIIVECEKDTDLEVICIGIDLNFLVRYIPAQNPVFSKLHRSFENMQSVLLNECHLPIAPKISSVLNEIINCVQKGFCRQLYLEAKVIELLAYQFEQFEESLKRDLNNNLRKEDIEKMHVVRDILINNLNTELSLKELAHEVATNEYSLKKQFKQVFGNTVFGYLHELKMEQSRQLLLKNDMKIAEVSERMGYKHATHFTSAFKKFFGYLPNKVKVIVCLLAHEIMAIQPFF